MAKGMAWLKTNFKLAAESSDDAVADFITDGCNMGVKSLSGYLNNYKAADEKSKNIAKELICLEERLSVDMRGYLSANRHEMAAVEFFLHGCLDLFRYNAVFALILPLYSNLSTFEIPSS